MNYVGAAAGGTVGFIVGDIPGAYMGAKIGNKLAQRMKRGRSVSRGRTSQRSGSRSRSRTGMSVVRRRFKRIRYKSINRFGYKRSKLKKSYGGSLRKAGVQKSRRKRVYFKSRKLRITRKFKRKVLRVITNSKFSGFYQHNSYSVHRASLYNGCQNIIQHKKVFVKDQQNPASSFYSHPLFSPSIYGYVAEVLYGNAAGPSFAPGSLEVPVGGVGDSVIMSESKIPVIKSWARFCIKNNYTFNVELKMFTCSPKNKSFFYRANDPVSVPGAARSIDPVTDWVTQMDNLRYSYMSHYGTLIRQPQSKGQAAVTVDPHTGIRAYGADPRQIPWWNKHWKCDVEKFVIYPGQCIEKIVKGPRDMIVDMARLWNDRYVNQSGAISAWRPGGSAFEEIQKWNQYVFWTAVPELSAFIPNSGSITCGRIAWPDENDGEGILIEQKFYTKIGLPEDVARRNEAAYESGDFLRENQKRDVLFIMNEPVKTGSFVTGDGIRTTQNSGVHEFTFTEP